MPRNGPGSSVLGNGPGSCGATVPVVATNRDQCSGDQHVAHCEALVPVVGTNRDRCPGYISPQPALRGIGPGCWHKPGPLPWLYKPPASTLPFCLKKFQDCVGVGWVLEFFSFDCTPGVRRNVRATLRSSKHRILGRG